jgi:hypothetical protein
MLAASVFHSVAAEHGHCDAAELCVMVRNGRCTVVTILRAERTLDSIAPRPTVRFDSEGLRYLSLHW